MVSKCRISSYVRFDEKCNFKYLAQYWQISINEELLCI